MHPDREQSNAAAAIPATLFVISFSGLGLRQLPKLLLKPLFVLVAFEALGDGFEVIRLTRLGVAFFAPQNPNSTR